MSDRTSPIDQLEERLRLLSKAEEAAGHRMFMGWPDRWYEVFLKRCPNGHVSTTSLRCSQGPHQQRCLVCSEPVTLTFPEDTDGPLSEYIDCPQCCAGDKQGDDYPPTPGWLWEQCPGCANADSERPGTIECTGCCGSGEHECVVCEGDGWTDDERKKPCPNCSDSNNEPGRTSCETCNGDAVERCDSCNALMPGGSRPGYVPVRCPVCTGAGTISTRLIHAEARHR